MSTFNSCLHLKRHGLIKSFDMDGEERSTIHLSNGPSILIFIAKDYIIGSTTVEEAISKTPKPDYIVYNAWQVGIVDAKMEAKKCKIPIISFNELKDIIKSINTQY